MDPAKWPDDISSPWIEGEQKQRELRARFRVSFYNAQNGLRGFIDVDGVRVTAGLAELDTAIKTIPVSLADAAMIYAIAYWFQNFAVFCL